MGAPPRRSVGLLANTFDQFADLKEKYWKTGNNTGNLLFVHAINAIAECTLVGTADLERARRCDLLLTTHMIWLREGQPPPPLIATWAEKLRDTPLLPVGVGLQAPAFKADFALHPGTVDALAMMQEHVTIGVRGHYTAEVLSRRGIRNIQVIGCPSLYLLPLFRDPAAESTAARPGPLRAVGNFRSLWRAPTPAEHAVLDYMARHCDGFVEQTLTDQRILARLPPGIGDWLRMRSMMFFDLEAWLRHLRRFDLSFGMRFHGNVAALLAGIPALLLPIDSRTREMAKFFKLPAMEVADFDPAAPLEALLARAGDATFRAAYPARLQGFLDFLQGNGVAIRPTFRAAVEAFQPGPRRRSGRSGLSGG